MVSYYMYAAYLLNSKCFIVYGLLVFKHVIIYIIVVNLPTRLITRLTLQNIITVISLYYYKDSLYLNIM